MVTISLTVLTSSQGLLIAASKANGVEYGYAVTSANCSVEFVKLFISFVALLGVWHSEGVTEDNTLRSSFGELAVYPIPAALYLVKNLMQYYIFYWTDAPSYQILKNLNIISTGVLYRVFLQKPLSGVQWSALVLLGLGCATAQLSVGTESVLATPAVGLLMAVVMAILSGAAGVYTELIMKTRPQRNINVQNVYLYAFGVLFNLAAIWLYDYDAVVGKGYFSGYNVLVVRFFVFLNRTVWTVCAWQSSDPHCHLPRIEPATCTTKARASLTTRTFPLTVTHTLLPKQLRRL